MSRYVVVLFEPISKKKGFFIFLLIATILVMILGGFAAVNFSGSIATINLGNISYVEFLKNQCGLVPLIFKMFFSILIFYFAILICGCKPFLIPFSVLFYLYVVYSQTVVFISIIMIYGFLNCIILIMFLFLFVVLLLTLLLLLVLETLNNTGSDRYFQNCFNFRSSNVLHYLIITLILIVCFCLILSILKSFVILLVY